MPRNLTLYLPESEARDSLVLLSLSGCSLTHGRESLLYKQWEEDLKI